MEAKLINKFVEFKGFPSECFDALDWAEYEAFEVGYMKALFEFSEYLQKYKNEGLDFSCTRREVEFFLGETTKEYFDVNNRKLSENDVIDIKQTVNGNNLFRITSLNPLHIVYHESGRDYEYNQEEMLAPSVLNGDVEWEIVFNYFDKDNINLTPHFEKKCFTACKSGWCECSGRFYIPKKEENIEVLNKSWVEVLEKDGWANLENYDVLRNSEGVTMIKPK